MKRNNRFNNKRKLNQAYPAAPAILPDEVFYKLNKELKDSVLKLDLSAIFASKKLRELETNHLKGNFKNCSIYDFRCCLACGELVLLLGCGVSLVLFFC